MPTDHREELRKIRDFPSLVRYLHDELDWPITDDDFDALTFEYRPEELGIKGESAAAIQEIRRLRPLSARQPWGIFFVKFEPKRLPVLALRRILHGVVLRKRASSNSSDRASWHMADLLFISSFGSADERQISLAYFTQDDEMGDLPTVKVLGWDGDNTGLHLADVAEMLQTKLRWPEDETDVVSWRSAWASAFTLRNREVITTSKRLAEVLAELARSIRKKAADALAIETERGPLKTLMRSFQKALIHDLSADDFADMYAQTIAYGLLSARISRPAGLVADNVADLVPITNPFLKELLETFLRLGGRQRSGAGETGIDFDELGINEVVQLLRDPTTNMRAILNDFGDRNPQEDPVIHFYELFLKEYDAKKRMQRGVFYTPRPVVSYIVHSVHELLQTEFGLADGLADTATWGEMAQRHEGLTIPEGLKPTDRFVTILDPATGTGTFPVEAIDVIHRTLTERWKREGHGERKRDELWNDYVPKHLLPRLHGYELLMAPYAIAHLKLGLKLKETGYRFQSDERARIYLTNALEPAAEASKQMSFADWLPALAHEVQAVNAVKRDQRFTVVIGNPPYSKSSQNQGRWIERLMEDYKRTVRTAETQIQALSDDYAKFLRLGHFTLEQSQAGILSYISNNGFLDGPLFRDMRNAMLDFFTSIKVLNLHGDSRKRFSPPDGSADENVFDIQQGVSVTASVRNLASESKPQLGYGELWGTRKDRYEYLVSHSVTSSSFGAVDPSAPYYLFIPVTRETEAEFNAGWHLYDIFGTGNRELDNHQSYGAGFVTQQDTFAIGFEPEDLARNVSDFLNPAARNDDLWDRFQFCSTNQWNFDRAKRELRGVDIPRITSRCLYRPFDYRFTVFNRNICTIIRQRITMQFSEPNLGLLATRRITRLPFNNAFVTNTFAEYKVASHDRNSIVFPLRIWPEREQGGRDLFERTPRVNLNARFMREIADRLSLSLDSHSGLPGGLSPEDIFHYIYTLLHSPSYRDRYGEFLKMDFPRIPLTSCRDLFLDLVALGGKLVNLHLVEVPSEKALSASYVESQKQWRLAVAKGHMLPIELTFSGPEKPVVGRVGWSNETAWIDAMKKKGAGDGEVTGTVGFHGVPREVWDFHIGGYQVCEKWLKDRKDRVLTAEDIAHYHRIVIALHETIRIMGEIDAVIDQHGGWPGAFAPGQDS